MSRTKPSLKPGGLRPFRAEVGHDDNGYLTLNLFAVASFARPVDPAHRWELKQAVLVLGAQISDSKPFVDRGRVRTDLRRDDRELIIGVCERFGWLRRRRPEVAP